MKRVPYEVMVNEFERVLTKYGFEPKDAKASAELFAQNSMAGVYSHGLNRFPRVVEYLKKGCTRLCRQFMMTVCSSLCLRMATSRKCWKIR